MAIGEIEGEKGQYWIWSSAGYFNGDGEPNQDFLFDIPYYLEGKGIKWISHNETEKGIFILNKLAKEEDLQDFMTNVTTKISEFFVNLNAEFLKSQVTLLSVTDEGYLIQNQTTGHMPMDPNVGLAIAGDVQMSYPFGSLVPWIGVKM